MICKEPGAILVSRIRFASGIVSLFLLSAANILFLGEEPLMRTIVLRVMLLTGCMAAAYLLPSVVLKHIPVLYGCFWLFVIVGSIVGLELSAVSTALLPLLVLSSPRDWDRKRMLLWSFPALAAAAAAKNLPLLLLLILAVCAVCWLQGQTGDEETEARPKWSIEKWVLLLAGAAAALIAVKLYGGRQVKSDTVVLVLLGCAVGAHAVCRLEMHTLVLEEDLPWNAGMAAASLLALFLLTIVTARSAFFVWIDLPMQLSSAVLLSFLFRAYEQALHRSQSAEPEEAVSDSITPL